MCIDKLSLNISMNNLNQSSPQNFSGVQDLSQPNNTAFSNAQPQNSNFINNDPFTSMSQNPVTNQTQGQPQTENVQTIWSTDPRIPPNTITDNQQQKPAQVVDVERSRSRSPTSAHESRKKYNLWCCDKCKAQDKSHGKACVCVVPKKSHSQ